MNLLAHAHVALGASGAADADYVMGALLPDLASMAGVRFDRAALPAVVDEGVGCHLRTDAVFHVLPPFMAGSAAIRRDVREAGLSAGAARAVGHVGWELLLDGTLIGSSTHALYREALDRADGASAGISDPDRWAWLLAHRDQLGWPRYDDPAWIAARLHRILDGRRLLRFDATHVPAVARVLEDHAAAVAAAAGEVLVATTDAVRAPEPGDDRKG
jgi:hypothetical protein